MARWILGKFWSAPNAEEAFWKRKRGFLSAPDASECFGSPGLRSEQSSAASSCALSSSVALPSSWSSSSVPRYLSPCPISRITHVSQSSLVSHRPR
eukprot:CAMPEP_0119219218 /NCGR_PEP_ID=MMETSP1327-20130426/22950_1 /TAXON_ID=38833 /ORGANISM="Micromonas pusilla, Strain RCC2306" /LENGTH=95 /DNA_ID=CAMNT_0007217277 /DNA_START=156 /DNA_END=440 /DNA_ORIENTATION=+